jgi:hypothetical protein
VAEKLHVLAYEVTGSGRSEVVTVAMGDPTDLSAIDQLAFHTGKRIKPMLAGDSEVAAAIQRHYTEAQKLGGPGARPTPAATAPAPTPGIGVPRAGGAPMATSAPTATPFEPPDDAAASVGIDGDDLPADAAVDGLEPIAAHTQGGERIEGNEEVQGQGDAADPVDGLEQANPREEAGAVEVEAMQELESAAAAGPVPSGDAVPLEDPAALQGWAEGPPKEGLEWTEDPGQEAAWVDPAQAEAPIPLADELPADAILGSPTSDGDAEAPAAWNESADPLAAGAADAWASPEEPAAQPSSGEGSPQEVAHAAGASPSASEAAEDDVEVTFDEFSVEEQAPSGHEEHLAAQVRAAAESYAGAETAGDGQQDVGGAADGSTDVGGTGADSGLEAPHDDAIGEFAFAADADAVSDPQVAPAAEGGEQHPEEEYAAQEQHPGDGTAAEELPAEDAYAQEQQPQAEQPFGAEQPAANEYAMDEQLAADGFPADEQPVDVDEVGEQPAREEYAAEEQPALDAYPADEQPIPEGYVAAEGSSVEEAAPAAYAEPDAASEADPAEEQPAEAYGADDQGGPEQTWEQGAADPYAPEERTQRLRFSVTTDESADPAGAASEEWAQAPGGAAWFGDAGALSAADLGTLQSLGIDPGDVAGALRALACLVRILNRQKAIDLDELAAEIRESRDASASEASEQPVGEGAPENRWPET